MRSCKSLIAVFVVAASMAGCADRGDILKKWSPNFADKCIGMGKETSLKTGNRRTLQRVQNIIGYWDKTSEGRIWTSHVITDDKAFCFGKPTSVELPISNNKKANAYIIDERQSDATIARTILENQISPRYNKLVKWSEKYKPQDALLWSRIKDGHRINIAISQAYKMARENFSNSVWRDIKKDAYLAPYADLFEEVIKEGKSSKAAHTEILANYVSDSEKTSLNDQKFLKWYDKFLHTQTSIVPTMCLDMDSNIDACLTTKTTPPGKDVAANDLTPKTLVQLSSGFFNKPYLTQKTAEDLLKDLKLQHQEKDTKVLRLLNQSQTNATKCCSNDRAKGGRGIIGLSFGGRFGLAF